MQKHRISTRIGFDQKIIVELKNDFDLLEILSLKFTQSDIYTSMCSDYGVVVGRISVNNGLGVPNARVSIFIPITEEDKEDPVISQLYPYTDISDKNENGYRYNLLPSRKQHGGHSPTGTFPDQKDVLNREEILEVYEKYYKYTVKTNNSGDFMIWGVPIGTQTIHVDTDLSDVGCFSLRPDDFIRQGIGVDSFKNEYTFKTSEDIDSLPQIVTFDQTIDVYPFWGNEELCEIGITRTDFDLSNKGIRIEPKAYLIGGTFTDTGKNSVNKNCSPRGKMGTKCDLTTKTGIVESIRFTNRKDNGYRPILENFDLNGEIDEDGSFIFSVPMNMDYLYTNEFGEQEYTNDSNKGIATSACYRFRFSLSNEGLERVRGNASYLVPNIREYDDFKDKSYSFSTNYDDYPQHAVENYILNNDGGFYYPQDYFFRLNYNKVYTVSSFQSSYFKLLSFKNKFIGLKDLVPTEENDCSSNTLTPPVNFGFKNYSFQLLISDVLLLFEHLINLLTFSLTNTVSYILHGLSDAVDFFPIKSLSKVIRKFAYRFQNSTQRKLYLINYPECEECNGENEYGTREIDDDINYCKVGTITISGTSNETNRVLNVNNDQYDETIQYASPICSGTTLITGTSQCNKAQNFVNNQNNYVLTYTMGSTIINVGLSTVNSSSDTGFQITKYLDISNNCTGYTLTFNDPQGIFNNTITYNCDIRDKNKFESEQDTIIQVEEGCSLYDVPYNESIVETYYVGEGRTPYTEGTLPLGANIVATRLSNKNDYGLPTSYDGETYSPNTPADTNGKAYTEFSNGVFNYIPGTQGSIRIFEILKEYRRRKRVGLLFCGGIVNYGFIDNWLSGSLYFFQFKSKVRWKNESSLELNVNRTNYCKDLLYYKVSEATTGESVKRFYYRSTITNSSGTLVGNSTFSNMKRLGHPTTMVDLGPRDEFIKEICTDETLDPSCSVVRSIGPTSFQDFGELLGLAINYRMDVEIKDGFSINDLFDNTGFLFYGFTNQVLDGDILQLISINNEVGIEQFNLQNQKYLGYSYQNLDPETYPNVFTGGTNIWGPLPITMQFDDDGTKVRYCLNDVGRLTESSQQIPFYLWDKKGTGFGPYNDGTKDNQAWDYSSIQVQPLQGMTYGYNLTGVTDNPSDKYLLPPITYTFSGLTITGSTIPADEIENFLEFDVIEDTFTDNHTSYDTQYPGFTYLWVTGGTESNPTSGKLYTRYGSAGTWETTNWDNSIYFLIKKTENYYNGNKQILSTPFLFYFGLRPGNTGVDKFIKRFGPLGAFPSTE